MSIKLVMAMLRYRAIAERKSLLGVVTETVSGAVLCDDVDINALVSQLYGNSISMTEMVIRTCSILRDHATEIQLKESSMLVQYLEPIMGANYAQTECQFRYCGTAIPFLTVRSTAR